MAIRIEQADPLLAEVSALLDAHMAEMVAITPAGSVYSLDANGLKGAGKTFWAAFEGERAIGCICLSAMDPQNAEIKSMHVRKGARGSDTADQLLLVLEDEARKRGVKTLWLETGFTQGFAAARRFYARNGYQPCPRYEPYKHDPHSCCMKKELSQ